MRSQNIAICGAGIIGLTLAYKLAQEEHAITLYDPAGFPNQSSASYIAGGMLAPYSEIDLMTPDFIQAGLHGIKKWADIARKLDVYFIQTGSLLIAHKEDTHMLDRFEQHLPQDSYEKTNPRDKEPALPTKFEHALFLPQEGAIHPQQIMRALCEHLQQSSKITLKSQPCKNTEKYDYIIDCTGFAAAKNNPELRGVKGEIAILENPDIELTRTIRLMHPRYPLYIVPRPDNIFMIGATQIESGDDTNVSLRSAMELLSALYSLHPSFGDAKIMSLQAGIRPAYPNNLPRIAREGKTIHINGLFRHGYLLSPIIADNVADMINKGTTQNLFMGKAA